MFQSLLKLKVVPIFILSGTLISGCASSATDTAGAGAEAKATSAETNTRSAQKQPAPRPADVTIRIDNFTFSPVKLTIPAGTKVTWINHDDVPHTATSSRKPRLFDSKTLDTDEQFSHVFTTPGTYEYFCAVHPHMKAQIIVK